MWCVMSKHNYCDVQSSLSVSVTPLSAVTDNSPISGGLCKYKLYSEKAQANTVCRGLGVIHSAELSAWNISDTWSVVWIEKNSTELVESLFYRTFILMRYYINNQISINCPLSTHPKSLTMLAMYCEPSIVNILQWSRSDNQPCNALF